MSDFFPKFIGKKNVWCRLSHNFEASFTGTVKSLKKLLNIFGLGFLKKKIGLDILLQIIQVAPRIYTYL